MGIPPGTTLDRWWCIRSVVVPWGRDEADPRRAQEPMYIGASSLTDRMMHRMMFDVFFTCYGRYTSPQLDSTVNTNSRRHVEDVGTVVTMITTDFEGGLGRSSSIAMVHLFCSTVRWILWAGSKFWAKKWNCRGYTTKMVEKQLGETRKLV